MNTPNKVGRPTKLDAARAKLIVDIVREGTPAKTAARCAGVGITTFKRWMQRGRSDAPEDQDYRAFRSAVSHARAEAERAAIGRITRAAEHDWRADAWLLEHGNPAEWGRVDRLKALILDGSRMATREQRWEARRAAMRLALEESRSAALPITYDDGGDAGGRPAET